MASTPDDDDDERGAIVITDPDMIQLASLQALKGALKLELKGIIVTPGQKPSTLVRRRFGWKGSKAHLLDLLIKHIKEEERKHGLDQEDR